MSKPSISLARSSHSIASCWILVRDHVQRDREHVLSPLRLVQRERPAERLFSAVVDHLQRDVGLEPRSQGGRIVDRGQPGLDARSPRLVPAHHDRFDELRTHGRRDRSPRPRVEEQIRFRELLGRLPSPGSRDLADHVPPFHPEGGIGRLVGGFGIPGCPPVGEERVLAVAARERRGLERVLDLEEVVGIRRLQELCGPPNPLEGIRMAKNLRKCLGPAVFGCPSLPPGHNGRGKGRAARRRPRRPTAPNGAAGDAGSARPLPVH